MSQQDQAAASNALACPVSSSNQLPIAELAHPDEDSYLSYVPDVDGESYSAEEYSDLESDDDDQSADWKDKGPSNSPMASKTPRQNAARIPAASNTQGSGKQGVNNTSGSSSRAGGNGHVSQPTASTGHGSHPNQGRGAPTGRAN